MAVLVLLAVGAVIVAAMTVPARRQRVDAARWWHALRALREDGPPVPPPDDLPDLYQAPQHVRVLRRRGRPRGHRDG